MASIQSYIYDACYYDVYSFTCSFNNFDLNTDLLLNMKSSME
jgi:hypothetical protein